MLRLSVSVSLALLSAGCPGSPVFEAADTTKADTDVADAEVADSVAPETADSETSTPDVTTLETDTSAAAGIPCDRGCAVPIASELTVSVAALVDHAGRATVALVESDDGGGTGILRLRRYDADGAWDAEQVADQLELAADVALAEEPPGHFHVLLEQGGDTPSPTIWFRPTPEPGWTRDLLLDAPRCERPTFHRSDDGRLFGSCILIDRFELHILELVGSSAETLAWTPRFMRDGLGWIEGVPRILTTRWDLDAAGLPRIATRCCTQEDPRLFHHGFDGETWQDADLGTTIGSYQQTDIALDALDRAHVVFVEYVPANDVARIVDRYFDDNTWKRVVVDEADVSGTTIGQGLRIEAGSDGTLHLIYRDQSDLVYRVWTGGPTWSGKVVAPFAIDASVQTTLTVEGTRPHVIVTDPADHPWWWIPASP